MLAPPTNHHIESSTNLCQVTGDLKLTGDYLAQPTNVALLELLTQKNLRGVRL
jgi:hypothetical protein